jgi:hypothetical protein
VPVIAFSGRKGGALKATTAISSGPAEGTRWKRGRNIQFNLILTADILVLFGTLGRRPCVPIGALLGRALDKDRM